MPRLFHFCPDKFCPETLGRAIPTVLGLARVMLAGAALVLWGRPTSVEAAPPTVPYLYPAGAAAGSTVDVQVGGTLDPWPVEVWSSSPAVRFIPAGPNNESDTEAGKEPDKQAHKEADKEARGKYRVEVAEDAAAGPVWLRFYNSEGVSAWRAFLVERSGAAERLEQEPNNAVGQAESIEALPVVVNGRLSERADVDSVGVELEAGQQLVARLVAQQWLASPMDGVLQVTDEQGFVLAQNDDDRGFDPLVVFTPPRTGRYIVRTFAFPETPNSSIAFASGEDFVYRLTLSTGPVLDHPLPLAARSGTSTVLEPVGWNLPDQASGQPVTPAADAAWHGWATPDAVGLFPLLVDDLPNEVLREPSDREQPAEASELPRAYSGMLEREGDEDAVRWKAAKGDKVRLRVVAQRFGFPLDPLLEVLDAQGKVVASADDGKGESDAELTWTAAEDGEYRAVVRDRFGLGGVRYAYRLQLEPLQPTVELTVKNDAYVWKPGQELEITVEVSRRDGFAGELTIGATGLPEWVQVVAAVSAAEGDTSKQVKLKLTADGDKNSEPYHGPFRIQASGGPTATATSANPFVPATTLWLTRQP